MKSKLSILNLLLFLFLSNSFFLSAESFPDSQKAEIQPVDTSQDATNRLLNHANLFSASTNGEAGIHLRDQLPEITSEEDSKEGAPFLVSEAARKTPDSRYLSRSTIIDGSQTIRKLIFPFHSHL